MSDDPALCVFARTPVAGSVKTRLIPTLGAAGAAELYAAFVRDVLATCGNRDWAHAVICVTGDDGGLLDDSATAAGFRTVAQVEGDLGARMRGALSAALEFSDRAVLIGTDLPTLPRAYLDLAADGLEYHDLVLGPAADGGYYLIGVGRSCSNIVPDVFSDIPWSSPRTLACTLDAARDLHLNVRVLPPWYDVDGPRDLQRLRMHLRLSPEDAPETARALGLGDDRTPF